MKKPNTIAILQFLETSLFDNALLNKSTLKIKAKIYQYFGIYLASKEETKFLWSAEGVDKIVTVSRSLRDPSRALQIVRGYWLSENGFVRQETLSFLNKKPWFFWETMRRLIGVYDALKKDLRKILWKIGIKI
jgi:hypothetical protein